MTDAAAWEVRPGMGGLQLQPLSHTVTAPLTYGYSLCLIRLQPLSHTVGGEPGMGGRFAYGHSFYYIRL